MWQVLITIMLLVFGIVLAREGVFNNPEVLLFLGIAIIFALAVWGMGFEYRDFRQKS